MKTRHYLAAFAGTLACSALAEPDSAWAPQVAAVGAWIADNVGLLAICLYFAVVLLFVRWLWRQAERPDMPTYLDDGDPGGAWRDTVPADLPAWMRADRAERP